jgi:type II secretory pathway pseudopilin PulG
MGYTYTPTPRQHTHGFTLIELSIILVIIGLLVGGVFVGQALIELARIRSTVAQLEQYETALTTFKLKYNGLPGDLPNPSQFWAGLTTATPTSLLGNQKIDSNTYDITDLAKEGVDVFWQLSEAGLVNGQFNGTFSTSGVPASKLGEAIRVVPAGQCCGVTQSSLTTAESNLTYSIALYLTYVNFSGGGQGRLTGADMGISPFINHSIDKKIDDGVARQGKVKAYTLRSNISSPCLLTSDGDYDLDQTTKSCVLEYIAQR